nr:VanW family protein [Lachnospiraceae bacterium]
MRKANIIRKLFLLLLCVSMLTGNVISAEAAKNTVKLSNITFDMDYYYNTYPDLQNAIGYDYAALYNHYLQHGLKEGRSGSAEFNCMIYRNNYSDLQTAFQEDYSSYCLHYEQHGKSEGRNAVEQFFSAHTSSSTTTADVIGSYSTNYDATVQRATNVELAASRINGVELQPGEEFSFSQTILPRTSKNGYVKAPVISNGKYVTGYGGGICQVSSTLYAAMLAGGVPATERHPHTLQVSYIPKGMDATISSPSKDLKFVNIFDDPIQISASTDSENGILTVSIIQK